MVLQDQFRTHQQKGWYGQPSRPQLECVYVNGFAGEELKPGWGVKLDGDDNWVKSVHGITTLAADYLGVVSYDASSHPTKDADDIVYEDGDYVKIMVRGYIWGKSGGAISYGNVVSFNPADASQYWTVHPTPSAFAGRIKKSIQAVSSASTANELVELYIDGAIVN